MPKSHNLLIFLKDPQDLFTLRKNHQVWTYLKQKLREGYFIGFCYEMKFCDIEDRLTPDKRLAFEFLLEEGIEHISFTEEEKEDDSSIDGNTNKSHT